VEREDSQDSDQQNEEDVELNKGGNDVNFTDSEDEDVSIRFTKRLIF
jgi:hypothetical protein